MKTLSLTLDNVKCEGCVTKIQTALGKHENIRSVVAEKVTGKVLITGDDLVNSVIVGELAELGFPESKKKGFFSKLSALIQK